MHYWHGNGKLAMLNTDEIDVAYSIINTMMISVGVRRKGQGRVYYFKPEFRDRSDNLLFEQQNTLKSAWDELVRLNSKRAPDEQALEAALTLFNELLYTYMEVDGWREIRKQIARKKVAVKKKKIEISDKTYNLINLRLKAENAKHSTTMTIDELLQQLLG